MKAAQILQLSSYAALFVLLIVSGYTDITRNKVYNWCTFPAMGLGLAFAYVAGGLMDAPEFNFVNSLAGLGVGGGIVLVFSLLGGIGIGDAKLMAAVGALAGFPLVLAALLYASLVGFVMAMGMLIWKGQVGAGLKRSVWYAFRWKQAAREAGAAAGSPPPAEGSGEPVKRPADTIPFGTAIALGTLIAFFLGAR